MTLKYFLVDGVIQVQETGWIQTWATRSRANLMGRNPLQAWLRFVEQILDGTFYFENKPDVFMSQCLSPDNRSPSVCRGRPGMVGAETERRRT